MPSSPPDAPERPPDRSARLTKWLVIAFAIVEAVLIGWAVFSGRLG